MSSIWNAMTAGNKSPYQQPQKQQQQQQQKQQSEPESTSSSSSYKFNTNPFDPAESQGIENILQNSSFTDLAKLHPLAGLDKDTLDYINLDESTLSDLPGGQSVLPSRGFTDDLCYGTGITYLTALSIGGVLGLQEGLRGSEGKPPKLRLNAVLNAVTRRGPYLGNSAGVIAITYNCINSLIGHVRSKHDAANSILAGALSGMLFKSTRGLKPMILSGGIVASVAAIWTITRRSLFPIPEPPAAPRESL
ncbi:hypothetical protein CDD81_6783 [Ophiocordyceps australis]|uniref:Mitochondrial import inner membrane translocase subunit TIM23 n=1 Tax=Ophiocordyceps australis TaxID=1399860 RepID=A0A2C5Y6Y4_9HYPO|nr:hypothetical protein CDD81_6783 [Ophiocordyceps australis]